MSPMIGSAAMSLSSVCVVANALRLRFFKRKEASHRSEPTGHAPVVEDNFQTAGESSKTQKGTVLMKKVLTVDGMMCAHCQMHVQKALAAVDGVQEASVDLEKKEATVSLSKEVSDQALMDAVTEAGYTPVRCVTL